MIFIKKKQKKIPFDGEKCGELLLPEKFYNFFTASSSFIIHLKRFGFSNLILSRLFSVNMEGKELANFSCLFLVFGKQSSRKDKKFGLLHIA
jgi:hypothetical protein